MSDQLLVVLQICLLALVYLVFLRVVRAVWVELRAEQGVASDRVSSRRARREPAPRTRAPWPPPQQNVPAAPGRLVVVAPPELAGRSFDLADETTIGRASGCGVALDNAHVSKLHARISRHGPDWVIEDLGSTNGTVVDGAPVDAPTPVRSGSRVEVGDVVLELT